MFQNFRYISLLVYVRRVHETHNRDENKTFLSKFEFEKRESRNFAFVDCFGSTLDFYEFYVKIDLNDPTRLLVYVI